MIRKPIYLSVLLTLFAFTVAAQVDIGIAAADMQCDGDFRRINLTFNKSLSGILLDAKRDLDKATSQLSKDAYRDRLAKLEAAVQALSPADNGAMKGLFLLDQAGNRVLLTRETMLVLKNNVVVDGVTGFHDVADTITYLPAADIDTGGKYLVMMTSLAKNPSIVRLAIAPNCAKPSEELPEPTYKTPPTPAKSFSAKFAAATGRDDALLFSELSYESRKPNNALDKNTHSFTGSASFVPVRIQRIGFGGAIEFQPFFYDLKINDKGKANSYISNFGTKVRLMRVFGDDGEGFNNKERDSAFPGILIDAALKMEMNDFFDGVNIGGEIMPTLPINVYQSRARLFRLDPQVGFTIARNIKESKRNETEVPRGDLARQKWILRPMAGFTLSYSEFRDRIIKPTFSLTYQIRWPLKAEDYYAKSPDGDNNDVYVGQSRLPRQYWKSKLEFDIGTIVTPFIAYESGRLPPNYKLISGQFKLGFSLKFVRKPN